jgi:hypothetical protein
VHPAADDAGHHLIGTIRSFDRRVALHANRIDIPGGNTQGRLRVQSAKLVPQPQDAVASGLLTLNEDPMRSSTKSISEPAI